MFSIFVPSSHYIILYLKDDWITTAARTTDHEENNISKHHTSGFSNSPKDGPFYLFIDIW